ncbi:MAG: alcohol dehydrogenase catalytic domain-containing protein [Methylobacteriaceae bacterium]|jgi:2-desacetyl-2-hydroxyethyl bacteriochlorophyllide A dehydrogenase|nr:alcohol dehydrogenase catalytic domain-containing protein [Methylobacteriaceae bacterium]
MLALKITSPGHTETCTVQEREPGAGEVKLRVHRVGLCGSDLNTFRGLNPMVTYPRIPGHEIGAEVIATGTGVSTCSVGDKVVAIPYTECGRCAACRAGRFNACEFNETLGVQRDGAMSATCVLPAEKLLVCNSLSFDDLALVEPLAVGMRVARRAAVDIGDHVVVFGCGVVGLGAIAGAAAAGGRVVAVDVDDRKKSIALACGAERFFNSRTDPLEELPRSIDGGRGPAVVVEAVGLDMTYRAAIDIVAFAGRVVYVGYAKKPVSFDTSLFVKKELDIRGSRNASARDFSAVLSLLEQRRYPLDRLITAHYPLSEAGRAFTDWAADTGGVTKFVVDIT